jgi:hypothetical protein
MKPVLYWAQTAERFLPPGLDPRNRPGPQRARAEGTTVEFPGRATYPSFLLQQGELGLEIGATASPPASTRPTCATSRPSRPWSGSPSSSSSGRTEGVQGPQRASTCRPCSTTPRSILRDSGIAHPRRDRAPPMIALDALDAQLDLGLGDVAFDFRASATRSTRGMHWSSDERQWLRMDGGRGAGAGPPVSPRPPSPAPSPVAHRHLRRRPPDRAPPNGPATFSGAP